MASDLQILSLLEARNTDLDKGTMEVVLLKTGRSANGNYYSTELLESPKTVELFKPKLKMYVDHDTPNNTKARKMRDWTATLLESWVEDIGDGSKALVGRVALRDGDGGNFRNIVGRAQEHGYLDEIGLSINARGLTRFGKIDGKMSKIVESFERVKSVDFVTEQAAGGGITSLHEAIGQTEEELAMLDELKLEELKEARPDLFDEITESVKGELLEENTAALEAQATAHTEAIEALQEEHKTDLGTVEEAAVESAKALQEQVIGLQGEVEKLQESKTTTVVEKGETDVDIERLEQVETSVSQLRESIDEQDGFRESTETTLIAIQESLTDVQTALSEFIGRGRIMSLIGEDTKLPEAAIVRLLESAPLYLAEDEVIQEAIDSEKAQHEDTLAELAEAGHINLIESNDTEKDDEKVTPLQEAKVAKAAAQKRFDTYLDVKEEATEEVTS